MPHLREALDIHLRLAAAAERNRTLMETLCALDTGVVLLDAAGRVLHANDAADAVSRFGDGLAVTGGRLDFADGAARGIRLTIARFYLYQAMAKMGVRRQAELVRLVGRLTPPVR